MPELRKDDLRKFRSVDQRAARHETTTAIAKQIMERENADRDAKTARLRAARLAREAFDRADTSGDRPSNDT